MAKKEEKEIVEISPTMQGEAPKKTATEIIEKKEETTPDIKETIKGLVASIKDLKKDNEILMQSADKRALARYYARHRADLPPVVTLRSMEVYNKELGRTETKLIVGWRMILDRGSFQVPGTAKWTEYQEIEVIYQDGTSERMQEMEFERRYEKVIKAKRIGVITDDKTKEETLKLQRLDNGEELTIGVQFVN